jgi:FdhE protein
MAGLARMSGTIRRTYPSRPRHPPCLAAERAARPQLQTMSTPAELLLLLDRRVAALRTARPDLADALAVQEQLIRTALHSTRPPEVHSFPLPREHLAARLREGVPMLHDQPVFIDVHFAADLFSRLVDELLQRDDDDLRRRLEPLVEAATRGLLDPERLFGEAFVQHAEHLEEVAAAAEVEPELLSTLARQAVGPLLRGYADRLLPMIGQVDDVATWTRGYCLICGGWPLVGELRGVELAQWLRCCACGASWRSQRLFCPYCANDDYRFLSTLTIEGEQRFRIQVCERCKGYLKVGNAFDPPPGELLALDDVASVHLDLAAIERGYQRPSGSGFSIELAIPEDEWVEELA